MHHTGKKESKKEKEKKKKKVHEKLASGGFEPRPAKYLRTKNERFGRRGQFKVKREIYIPSLW